MLLFLSYCIFHVLSFWSSSPVSLTPSPTLSLSFSNCISLSLTLSLSLTHTFSHSHTHTHSLSLTHIHTLSHSLSLTFPLSHSFFPSLSLPLSLFLLLSLSLPFFHSLGLSFFPSYFIFLFLFFSSLSRSFSSPIHLFKSKHNYPLFQIFSSIDNFLFCQNEICLLLLFSFLTIFSKTVKQTIIDNTVSKSTSITIHEESLVV